MQEKITQNIINANIGSLHSFKGEKRRVSPVVKDIKEKKMYEAIKIGNEKNCKR